MDVQMPDGTIIQGVPDGITRDELQARFAKMTPATTMQKAEASIPMRVVKGLRDPIDAGAQFLAHVAPEGLTNALDYFPAKLRNSDSPLLQTIGERYFADPRAGAVDKEVAGAEQQYQQSRYAAGAEPPDWDVARFTGKVASPANATVARAIPVGQGLSLFGLGARGAAAGGVGGTLSTVTDPKAQENFWLTKGIQAGLGAGSGAVLTPLLGRIGEKVAGYIGRNLAPAATEAKSALRTDELIKQALDETGQSVDEIPQNFLAQLRGEVSSALKDGRQIDSAALMRKKDFQALDVPATLGQITRDASQFAKERNLRAAPGVGEPLLTTFQEQNRRLTNRLANYGGDAANEAYPAGLQLSDVLKGIDEGMRKRVSAAYTSARESAGRDMDVPLQGLAQDLETITRDFGNANVPGAVRNRLAEYGILGGQQTKTFTINDAEEVLQQINKLYDPAKKAEAGALDALRAALKKSILSADDAGGVFAEPRNLAAQRFQGHELVPALKAAAEGTANPDTFVRNYVVRGRTDQVQTLARLLKNENPEAFQEARNQIGATLYRAAFGENMTGDKLFRPELYSKALREIGTDKLRAFYSPAELEQIQRIGRVGAYINSQPAAAPVLGNPNMVWAAPLIQRIPGLRWAPALYNAAVRPVADQKAVRAAVEAAVPEQTPQLPPEQVRMLSQILSLGAVGAGGAAAIR